MQFRPVGPSAPGIWGMGFPHEGGGISLSRKNPVAGSEPATRYGIVLLAQTGFAAVLEGLPSRRPATPALNRSSPAWGCEALWQPACAHFMTIRAAASQTLGPPVPPVPVNKLGSSDPGQPDKTTLEPPTTRTARTGNEMARSLYTRSESIKRRGSEDMSSFPSVKGEAGG